MPKVSIIISAYNVEKYVASTLQSVLNQTFQDFEILIADNGSTDNTGDEIKKISDSRIHLVEIPVNNGANYAANILLSMAKGEYVALLCADDLFMPEKIEKQVEFLDKNRNYGAVFTDIKFIDDYNNDIKDLNFLKSYFLDFPLIQDDYKLVNRTRHEWLNYFLYKGNTLLPSSLLMRTECLDKVGHLNTLIHQTSDIEYWIRLCCHYEIFVLPEKLLGYRIRTSDDRSNISAKSDEATVRSYWENTHLYDSYFRINSKEEFLKIFPDEKKYEDIIEDELVLFFTAKVFLRDNVNCPEYVVIDHLYRFLQDKDIARKVEQKYNFTIGDFIKLTGGGKRLKYFNDENLTDNISNINNFIKKYNNSNKSLCIYGAGQLAQQIVQGFDLSNLNILGFIDKDPKKAGTKIGNYKIYSLSDLKVLNPDVVAICLIYRESAVKAIKEMRDSLNLKYEIAYDLISKKLLAEN